MVSPIISTELQHSLQQQTVNIRVEPARRASDLGVQKIPEALKKEADATYTAVLRRLLVLGGISGSTALGLTVASSVDLGVESKVFHALGYTCLGFTLGCLSVIAISKIFLKKIKEIHHSVHSIKKLIETTSFIPLRRSLSSPNLPLTYLDPADLPPPSKNTYLLPVAPHLLPVALPVRRNSNT